MRTITAADAAPLVEVTRRDERTGRAVVESMHHGHLVLVRRRPSRPATSVTEIEHGASDGVAALGSRSLELFVRSMAKPLQATVCLDVLDQPTVSAEELAVAWASHRGEPVHLDAVRRLLARSGTPPDDLTCPPAEAEAEPGSTPTRLQHNCSGKHALFAWAARQLGLAREAVLDPSAPLQRRILDVLDGWLDVEAVGIDGCGAPAVVGRLDRLAATYAALAQEPWARPVRTAGLDAPLLVGGTGRVESALLGAGVVAKVGAEGSYACGWTDAGGDGWGLAVKAVDGSVRGSATAAVAVLEGLGTVAEGIWREPAPTGGGRPVGEVRASATLRRWIDEEVRANVVAG